MQRFSCAQYLEPALKVKRGFSPALLRAFAATGRRPINIHFEPQAALVLSTKAAPLRNLRCEIKSDLLEVPEGRLLATRDSEARLANCLSQVPRVLAGRLTAPPPHRPKGQRSETEPGRLRLRHHRVGEVVQREADTGGESRFVEIYHRPAHHAARIRKRPTR